MIETLALLPLFFLIFLLKRKADKRRARYDALVDALIKCGANVEQGFLPGGIPCPKWSKYIAPVITDNTSAR